MKSGKMFWHWIYWQLFPDETWWDTLQGLRNVSTYLSYVKRLRGQED